MNVYLKVPNTSTLYICRRRTTATMTARWNSAAVATDSPDAPDPHSSIISPPGPGTDHSALTGELRVRFFILCQNTTTAASRVLKSFIFSIHQCVRFIIRRRRGLRVPCGKNQECFLNF